MSEKYLKPRKKTITVRDVVLTCDDCGATEKHEDCAVHWRKHGCLGGWNRVSGSGLRFGQTLVVCSSCSDTYRPAPSLYDLP